MCIRDRAGTAVNIVLNPLFIHGFGWGAAGSAGATVIANICTDAYFVWFMLRHSSNLSIDPRTVIDRARRRLAVTAREVGSILAIGIPSAITNLTQSVGIVMINLFLLPYGTDAVAAMGIALKVIMIAVLVFVGFAFGAQPLIGYNYGARNMPRLRGILRFSYLFLSLFALVMTVVLSLSDRLLMGFFIEDATIITLGAGMLRDVYKRQPYARSEARRHGLPCTTSTCEGGASSPARLAWICSNSIRKDRSPMSRKFWV